MDWLIQHVCVDSDDRPIAMDPYMGCPANSKERRLKIGDLMPYMRHDQPAPNGAHPNGFQRHDSYPIKDLRYGGMAIANDFDFAFENPYAEMYLQDGNGYDLYYVEDGWASAGSTQDGGGYSSSFFGPSCKPSGGWVFFPTNFLVSLTPGAHGQATVPIRGSYWEQNGETWPGKCAAGVGFSDSTLTTWEFERAFRFSGHNGTSPKLLDTIISTHGMPLLPGANPHSYHLERFYFTDMYGITRWEAWAPSPANKPAAETCGGETEMTYRGVKFTETSCRDWSEVTLINPARPRLPWPYPELNLLKNYHFDSPSVTPWQRTTARSDQGNVINFSIANSANEDDSHFSQQHVGVRYLVINCGGRCNSEQAIYQDIPVSSLAKSTAYDYGFVGLAEGNEAGKIKVELTQLDMSGRPLSSDSFVTDLPTNANVLKLKQSVYKEAYVILRTSPTVSIQPQATTLRFSLSPQTPANYLLVSTWLMPR